MHPTPSVGNLPAALTINGTTVQRLLGGYYGGDAAAGGWAPRSTGPTLALQAGTAPTYNDGSFGRGALDDSVLLNGGGYYLAGNTTDGNVGTMDLVPRLLATVVASQVIAAKRNAGVGWEIGFDATPALYATLQDAGGAVTVTSAALVAGSIVWAEGFFRRAGSGQWYIWSAASGAAVDISARALTLDAAVALALGATSAGGSVFTRRLFYFDLFAAAAWLDTHLQATVAATDTALLEGTYPALAMGTKLPSTRTRASAAYVDVIDSGTSKLYYVGSGAMRTAQRTDTSSVTDTGLLIEKTETNRLLQSGNMHVLPWVERGGAVCTPNTNETTSPTGAYDAMKIEGLTNGDDIYQGVDGFGANAFVSPRFWVKRISTSGILRFATTGLGDWQIDLADLPDAWVLINEASAYVTQVTDWQADAAGILGFVDFLGTVAAPAISVYLWNPAVTTAPDIAGSDIPTAAAPVVRAADSLVYNADNFPTSKGRVHIRVLREVVAVPTDRLMLSIDDGSNNNRHTLYVHGTTRKATLAVVSGGVTQADIDSAGVLNTGAWRTVEEKYTTNLAQLSLDSVAETPDTSAAMPTGMTAIRPGSTWAAGYEFGGIINEVRIKK